MALLKDDEEVECPDPLNTKFLHCLIVKDKVRPGVCIKTLFDMLYYQKLDWFTGHGIAQILQFFG